MQTAREGPFYMAVLHDHDQPIDGPGYLLNNLRRRISEIEEWQTAIETERKSSYRNTSNTAGMQTYGR